MLNKVPVGEACGQCHLRFGSHQLAKFDDGRWFHHEPPFKRCYEKHLLTKRPIPFQEPHESRFDRR